MFFKSFLLLFSILIIICCLKTSYVSYENLKTQPSPPIGDNATNSVMKYLYDTEPTSFDNYKSSSINTPSNCVTTDGKYGFSWNVTFNNGNSQSICVPEIYSDASAYSPCDSENNGIPDVKDCKSNNNNIDDRCKKEIGRVTGVSHVGQEQQYVYNCTKNTKDTNITPICPCMPEYGSGYNGPHNNQYKCDNYPKSWECLNDKCIQSIGGPYDTLDACSISQCGSSTKSSTKSSTNNSNITGRPGNKENFNIRNSTFPITEHLYNPVKISGYK